MQPTSKSKPVNDYLTLGRIEYFQGTNVLSLASGSDFTVALGIRKNAKFDHDTKESLPSSCPLGLPIFDGVNLVSDQGQFSIPQAVSNAVTDMQLSVQFTRQNRKVQPSVTEEGLEEDEVVVLRKSPQVERFAKSGMMFINTNDSINYLSNRISVMQNPKNPPVQIRYICGPISSLRMFWVTQNEFMNI